MGSPPLWHEPKKRGECCHSPLVAFCYVGSLVSGAQEPLQNPLSGAHSAQVAGP
jgi:hypothetical protein